MLWVIRGLTGILPGLPDPLDTENRKPTRWAELPTRLEKISNDVQNGLINRGYAACEIALRGYFAKEAVNLGADLTPPTGFPIPGGY